MLGAADVRHRRRATSARSPRPPCEAALDTLDPQVPFAVLALGRLRRRRAVLRQRPRRHLRLRRRRRDRLRGGRPGGHRADAVHRRVDAGRAHLRRSTPTCGPRASRDRWPAASRPTAPTGTSYALVWERQAMLRARPVAGDLDLGRRLLDDLAPRDLGRAVGRRRPRDPPHEGPHRARAHARRRGPGLPPQARSGLAVRHRVHRAAAAAAARRARHRHRPGHRAARGRGRPRTPTTPSCCSRPTGSASGPGTAGTSSTARRATRCRVGPRSCSGWPARSTSPRPGSASATAGSPAGPAPWSSASSTANPDAAPIGSAPDRPAHDHPDTGPDATPPRQAESRRGGVGWSTSWGDQLSTGWAVSRSGAGGGAGRRRC